MSETLEEFSERRRCGHITYEETERDLFEALKENANLRTNLHHGRESEEVAWHTAKQAEAHIKAVLALKMPQPTHEDDSERDAYMQGWDDCMGDTVKVLHGKEM